MNNQRMASNIIRLQPVTSQKKRMSRELRKNQTPSERILWSYLRNRKCGGMKFRRQQVIDGFIVDFYCDEKRLVVEVDGSVHDSLEQKKYDEHRRNVFKERGLHEMRFRNRDVSERIEWVLQEIMKI